MPRAVISVENLSKVYLVGHRGVRGQGHGYVALRDSIGRELRNAARKGADILRGRQVVQGDEVEEFWALKNVSFEVKEGEVLGIIGRNGAGKSTLLKILSRITEPTAGRVTLRGRVSSLLEVGTGFHPELSGRENIYLNGAILGMSRGEIRRKFDEIVAFAEIEKFLDTPVKRYSSGMYVRLAFAVAAHLEPEVLIVDEVLAVGDSEFQKKCLGKMDDISRREGRTVIVVSHNLGIVSSLCASAIWLDHGSMLKRGNTRTVVAEYLTRYRGNDDRVGELADMPRPHGSDDRLRLQTLEWLSDLPLRNGEPLKARIHFETRSPVSALAVGISFSSVDGARVLSYETDFQDGFRPFLSVPGKYFTEVEIDSLPIGPGVFNVNVGCRSGDSHVLDDIPACMQLEVIAGPTTPPHLIAEGWGAGVHLQSRWSWDSLDEKAKRPARLA